MAENQGDHGARSLDFALNPKAYFFKRCPFDRLNCHELLAKGEGRTDLQLSAKRRDREMRLFAAKSREKGSRNENRLKKARKEAIIKSNKYTLGIYTLKADPF